MSEIREVKQWALQSMVTPELLASSDVEGVLAATLDSQVRAAGWEPIDGTRQFRLLDRQYVFDEEIADGTPWDAQMALMTVRAYEKPRDTPSP